ncbi:hypothetical protein J7F03_07800 [Streptomyces sp. ISL-43]|uniref:hypothetical protein n=1 Tax=Streptomyces sp. ISL-43 TaxID=2819183 RepID=UPI001BEC74B4|nr:hypothetical protein [Streptomyces sp. ISL-43]MBT2446975.1 hypothetical protein [Streptomyces sp. ISL-43]
MDQHRDNRRLAWCVALVLRHAPQHVATALIGRLDSATRNYLTRDEWLPASAVSLLLRDGSDQDRRSVARNPHVLGRPLPGLPGPARYAARRTPPALLPVLGAELGRDPAEAPLTSEASLTSEDLLLLLRRHGTHRPGVPLDILALPHEADPELLWFAHAREPLPPGSVEALLLRGGLPPRAARGLLDLHAARSYGRSWYRPAVRAVRMGLITQSELVDDVRPAGLALLLADLPATRGLRWSLPELAGMHTALRRTLAPLGDDPRLWAELLRHAHTFPGPLTELASRTAAGTLPEPPDGPSLPGLARAVARLAPTAVEPTGGVERELALASLAVPMDTVEEDIRWVRDCLDRQLLTGVDVIRHKLPAVWALDEDHWLGAVDHPDRYDRPEAVLAARAEADRLFAVALGDDPDAWWRAASTLPDFAGTLPHLLLRVTEGGSVSGRP